MKIGIIGLPNVGKSTLFKALTKKEVDISNYPFTTVSPNIGIVAVPDERLYKIAEIVKPQKIIPAVIEAVDIAGLVKDSHKGAGLGNQFLSHLREVFALIEVVRTFEEPTVAHIEGEINPERDIEIIAKELRAKDAQSKEEVNLLSRKPIIYLFNGPAPMPIGPEKTPENFVVSDLKDEKADLSELIKKCYETLGLITFFTILSNEVRAWSVKSGTSVKNAGRVIHQDFQDKFIRALVVSWEDFVKAAAPPFRVGTSWQKAREKGLIKTEGRDYPVRDGDIIEFKI